MIRARKKQADNEKEVTKPVTGQPSSLETLRKHRIIRVRRQNERLALDLKRAKGELVSLDSIKREVLAANAIVKSQLLAIPFRIAPYLVDTTDPGIIAKLLTQEITQCLNDLAYGTPAEDGTCPCCGRKQE